MPMRPRDPVDKVLIHACGEGLVMSTLGQKADIIKERLAEAGYRIIRFRTVERQPLVYREDEEEHPNAS